MNNLDYFLGKICTIFVLPINRDFQSENPAEYPKPVYKYFLGVVESIDHNGILLTQATTGLKTFFFRQHVVAIAEEAILDPQNPEDAKEIDDFSPVPPRENAEVFIDAEDLAKLSKELKDKFTK